MRAAMKKTKEVDFEGLLLFVYSMAIQADL